LFLFISKLFVLFATFVVEMYESVAVITSGVTKIHTQENR